MDLAHQLFHAASQMAVLSIEATPAAFGFWLWHRSRYTAAMLAVAAAPAIAFFTAALFFQLASW